MNSWKTEEIRYYGFSKLIQFHLNFLNCLTFRNYIYTEVVFKVFFYFIENRLHLKGVTIANIEKKIDFLESKVLEFTNSPNEGTSTGESSWFLIPFAQQSQGMQNASFI